MKHFFISYSRIDAEFGENLMGRMRAQGFETWVDTEQLLPGHDWRTAIDQAIRASAAVVVVMTPAAKASEYVTYEWAYALGADVPVIPVLLDRMELHPRLAALQYVEFTVPIHLRPWERLFDSLRGVMPQEAPQAQAEPIDVQKLIAALDSPDPAIREKAIDSLSLANQYDAREALVAALQHRRRDVRIQVAIALAEERNEQAIPALVEALYGPTTKVSAKASEALIRIGSPAIASLSAMLGSQDPDAQQRASRILGMQRNPAAIPALTELLRAEIRIASNSHLYFDDHVVVAESVVKALGKIGHLDGAQAIIELMEYCLRQAESTRGIGLILTDYAMRPAFRALGNIGSPEAVPTLLRAFQVDELQDLRPEISTALVEIGGPAVIEALRGLLHDPACTRPLELTVRNLLQRLDVTER